MRLITVLALVFMSSASAAQGNLKCPVCTGPNVALQFTGSACVCGTITGATGPAGPAGPQGPIGPAGPAGTFPASTCPATGTRDHWLGSTLGWDCAATNFLTY